MDETEYREKLNVLEERLTVVYRERRALQEAFAVDHPAVLPPARFRTDAQARVARCPRCGLSQESRLEKCKTLPHVSRLHR